MSADGPPNGGRFSGGRRVSRFLRLLHLGQPLERERLRCGDAHQTRTKPDGFQCAGLDLLVDLFSTDQPIIGQLACRHERPWMHLEALDRRFGRWLMSHLSYTAKTELPLAEIRINCRGPRA